MSGFPSTRIDMLMRLRDPLDHATWREFVSLYQPALFRFARRRGLSEADAEDLVQSVLIAVAERIDQWQPDADRARFRTWLARVASNQTVNLFRRRRADLARGGTSVHEQLHQLAERSDESAEIRCEVRRVLFRKAAGIVQTEFAKSTWEAFRLTAVEQKPVADVARFLGRSVGSIYTARSRVMRRLQEVAQDLQHEDDSWVPPIPQENDHEFNA